MNTYEAIYSRRTIRDFKDKKIDHATLRKILDAGLHAPSNNHLREWEFIIVQDEATKLNLISPVARNITKKNVEAILDSWNAKDGSQREMYFHAIPNQYDMLLNADCVILPLFYQSWPLLNPTELGSLNAFASIWCCIENILLAAVSEGIYGVTRIPLGNEPEHIKKIIGFPDNYYVPCYIALGYPKENCKSLSQHLPDIETKIHLNHW